MPTTQIQIYLLPFLPGTDSRANLATNPPFNTFLQTLSSAPGITRVLWTPQLDNPDVVGVFAFWDDCSARESWESNMLPIEKLSGTLEGVLDGAVWEGWTNKRFTVDLPRSHGEKGTMITMEEAMGTGEEGDAHDDIPLKSIFESPLTKVWTWYFPLPPNQSTASSQSTHLVAADVDTKFSNFVACNTTMPHSKLPHLSGWRVERDIFRDTPARSYTGFVGQATAEEFKQMPPFEGNLEGRIGLTMRTFSFRG